jgi:hypothetical protein
MALREEYRFGIAESLVLPLDSGDHANGNMPAIESPWANKVTGVLNNGKPNCDQHLSTVAATLSALRRCAEGVPIFAPAIRIDRG